MSFAEHLTDQVFKPRLQDNRVLVVYDEHDRYRDICSGLADETCQVIFTDKRPISSRQEAIERWLVLCADTTYQTKMLVHVPVVGPRDLAQSK